MNRKVTSVGVAAVAAVLVVLGALGGSASAAPSQKGPPNEDATDVGVADPQARFVPGQVVVRFKDDVPGEARAAVLAQQGAVKRQSIPLLPNVELVRLGHGRAVEAVVAALSRRPEIVYAEPNFIGRLAAIPNDPRWSELWGLEKIDAPEAWDTTTGSATVVAGVMDTGVAYDHPDLAPNMWTNPGETGGGKETNGVDDDGNGRVDDWRGWDFQGNDNDPRDQRGHGTHVAGTIGAVGNNAYGVAGVNWNVKLMNLKVFGATGGAFFSDMAAAAAYAGVKGAKVVNVSIGCLGAPCFSQVLKDAIDGAPNTLFVMSAGNDNNNNDTTPSYPCNFTSANLICVAATDESDNRASFSNYGATSVDLAAPGTAILSTWLPFDTIASDGFESGLANWTSGGTQNTWAATTEAAVAGTQSATDSPGTQYVNNTNSFIRTTNPISLAGKTGCFADYWLRLATEQGFDVLWTEASTNGSTWTNLGGWTGSTVGAFLQFSTNLSAFDGQATAFFRYRFQSDVTITDDGVHIDDTRIRCAGTTYDDDDFKSIQGTSMAAPHVAGAAALGWAANPAKTVAEMRTAILNSVDVLPSLSGLVATGGRLNLRKLVAAVVPPLMCLGSPATITGTAAGETLTGTPGNDVIVGLDGDDNLDGAGGNDKLCGGAGADTGNFASAPAAVNANLSAGTATGDGSDMLAGIEKLVGSGFNDTLIGDGANNVLDGGAGVDTLVGLAGNDTILGGPGGDVLRGGLDDDGVDGGDGGDVIDFQTAANAIIVDLGVGTATGAGSDTLTSVENVFGSNFGDTITGSDVRNVLNGFGGVDNISALGGNDELLGGVGNDILNGGTGGDILSGQQGDDQLLAGDGNDQLRGGLGNDDLRGEGGLADTVDVSTAASATVDLTAGTSTGLGNDTLQGIENIVATQGADVLTGNDASNFIIALDGNDQIFGLAGNDVFRAGFADDIVDGGDGVDLLDFSTSPNVMTVSLLLGTATGAGSDTLSNLENVWGGVLGDNITGSDGPNTIVGLGGNDTLAGLGGNDALHGNDGDDNIDGGDGTDLCRQNAGTGTIVNCEA
jgi:subtilisin family serine protease